VWIQLAQELNSDSRIVVENNSTSIIWTLSEKDLKNYFDVIQAVQMLAEKKGFTLYCSKNVKTVAELESTALPAFHLSGTTRMSKKEIDSVVDKNGKLFDIDNCYILGSSVFTTPSWVNPTLSIMALSIRTVEKSWLH
jgi:choline dehydrogenase-like flavoprotein